MTEFSPENTVETPTEKKPNVFGRFVLDLFETLLLSILLYLGINAISARVRVDGFSMRPTLEDGQYVLVNRLSYNFGDPERGDIVVFHSPIGTERLDLIKRVVGLPGETVTVRQGNVFINVIIHFDKTTHSRAACELHGRPSSVSNLYFFAFGIADQVEVHPPYLKFP